MDRRGFFFNSALVSAGAAASLTGNEKTAHSATIEPPDSPSIEATLSEMPIFCAHEHWGSMNALGTDENGFCSDTRAGAEPKRDASVWDILLDPYFGGWIYDAGHDVHNTAQKHGYQNFLDWWRRDPETLLAMMVVLLREQHYTGAFQCIRLGIQQLYGLDITEAGLSTWQQADNAIKSAYDNIFGWYQKAMEKMHISTLIRPVHPEYFLDAGPNADQERAFMHPILRIDPLLDLWPEKCPRRDRLAAALGVEPRDANSWRAFLDTLFDLAANQGNVGIKQLQAYSRPLNFAHHKDRDVRFSGALTDTEKLMFQDWVMHECCKRAHERNWPHQVHTGTHNLSQSSPLPLASLAKRYPRMNLVLLHCWPFLEESGFLAKLNANIYLDTCWETVLNPAFLEEALSRWVGYLPASKLMCSQDATSVEMAAGSIVITRQLLSRALTTQAAGWQLPETTVLNNAADILNNNAVKLYGVGTTYAPC